MIAVNARLEDAREKVFRDLKCCPCCAAEIVSVDKSDACETIEFACEAAVFRLAGSAPGISRVCPSSSYVAIAGLEREAARLSEADL